MTPVAVAFGVLDLTGDASRVGVVLACQIGAQVALQLLGGALADRGSRQFQMVRADVLAGAALAAVAYLLVSGQAVVGWLGALMAVVGVALALHGPASVGLLPQVVDDDKLQSANALLGMARSGAMSLGAATAGLIVAFAGPGWAILVDALTFLVSGLLVAGLRPRPQARGATATLWSELRAGWTEFSSHTWLWAIVLQFSIMLAATEGTLGVLGPTVAKRSLGGPTDWGWILSAMGVGTLAGGFLALRLEVRRPMLVASSLCFGFALPALLLVGPSPVWAIALGSFASGICGALFGVIWFTELQRRVAPEALSRVSAYDHMGSSALAPLGVVFAGSLLEAIGARTTLWIAAGLVVLPTLLVLCVRDVRQLRSSR